MSGFDDFREPSRIADLAVQHTLRRLEERTLAHALLEMPEEDRQIVLRNMSVRAAELLMKDIKELQQEPAGTFTGASRRAREKVLHMLRTELAVVREDEQQTPDELPSLRWDGEETIIESFVLLKRFVRKHGAMSLEPALAGELPPLLRKGLELYLKGWDPALIQSILDQMKESLIARLSNEQNMIIEGISGLAGHNLPGEMREKLKAFRLGI